MFTFLTKYFNKNQQKVSILYKQWIDNERNLQRYKLEKYYLDMQSRLSNYIEPSIGNLTPREVTPQHIANIINNLNTFLARSTVKKIKQDLNNFFKYCKSLNLIENLPTSEVYLRNLVVVTSNKTKPHPAIQQKDIGRFVKILTSPELIDNPNAQAILFTLLTAVRIGNVVGSLNNGSTEPVKWSDFSKDLSKWTIQAKNLKVKANGNLVIPLSKQARWLLHRIKNQSSYVFCNTVGSTVSYKTINALMKRISKIDKKHRGNGFKDESSGTIAHIHGFRASFKTWCTNEGIDWNLSEIALHHRIDKLNYDRANAFKRRKIMMQKWSDFCFSKSKIKNFDTED